MSKALYLEVDEDITSAVEKLTASTESEIQVVVPKRSTLLQSMINLKLLKKAADQHKKELVLVTTDRLSSHLAGRAGIAVAAKLGAEAAVPESEVKEPDTAEVIDGGVEETGANEPEPKPEPETEPEAKEAEAATSPVMKQKALDDKPKPEKPKKTAKVPDFNVLQKRILWVTLGALLLIGLLFGNFLIGRADVTIYAKGAKVPAEASLTADPAAPVSDVTKGIVKAQALQSNKDLSAQVEATGKKDVGTKASGTMTISNAYDSNPRNIPAGTKFTASGKTFLSQEAVTVPGAGVSGGHVVAGTATVGAQAEQAGDSYNLAATNYTISGQPSQVTGHGGQMSGGTSKQITVVSQGDVDKAAADLLAKDKDGALDDLKNRVTKGYQMIPETVAQKATNQTSDPAVDSEASTVTVKLTANYDGLALATDDLKAALAANIQKQVGPDNQIYDEGVGGAKFEVTKKNSGGSQVIHVTADGSAGPKIDTTAIAKQIKGKKFGDATDIINKTPGVDHSEIKLSPGWQTKLPRRTSKIKIEIKVASPSG